ncbi:MAG: hypothetical protein U0167_09915 [bacterium]
MTDAIRVVNRSAAVVRPREPFVRWVMSIDDSDPDLEGEVRSQASVYLVPPDPNEEEEAAPLSLWFVEVFDRELEGWYLDESLWPQSRDIETFLEWFEVTTESVVVDLAPGPVDHEAW